MIAEKTDPLYLWEIRQRNKISLVTIQCPAGNPGIILVIAFFFFKDAHNFRNTRFRKKTCSITIAAKDKLILRQLDHKTSGNCIAMLLTATAEEGC